MSFFSFFSGVFFFGLLGKTRDGGISSEFKKEEKSTRCIYVCSVMPKKYFLVEK